MGEIKEVCLYWCVRTITYLVWVTATAREASKVKAPE